VLYLNPAATLDIFLRPPAIVFLAIKPFVLGRILSDVRFFLTFSKNFQYPFFSFMFLLEHFNIFCSHLGRREDKAGKEDCTAILKYREQI